MSEDLNRKKWWETKTAIITFSTALVGLVTALIGIGWPPPPPPPVSMEGAWIYKADAVGGTVFPDGCSERVGTVRIERVHTTPSGLDVKLRGKRIWCVRGGSKEKVSPVLHWNSDIASVTSPTTMYFKLTTQDIANDQGIVFGGIESEEETPIRFSGTMYYLPPDKSRWIQANIDFFREGWPEATSIKQNFPMR